MIPMIVPMIVSICALVAGVVTMLVVRRTPGGPPYPTCYVCDYNLVETIGHATRCPECGADFSVHGIRPPFDPREQRRRMIPVFVATAVALLLFAALGGTFLMAARSRVVPPPTLPVGQPQAQQTQQQASNGTAAAPADGSTAADGTATESDDQ